MLLTFRHIALRATPMRPDGPKTSTSFDPGSWRWRRGHIPHRNCRPERRAVVLAKVGDRLEVGRQPPGQPHQLDIALRFPFEPPARLHAVEIAVEIDLQ